MSETMNIPQSVTKKLLAVMGEVSYIQRDKKNDFHKYSYASEKAIKETLHPLLVKHGLLFLPVGCETISERENVTAKGNREQILTIRYLYRWVDAETGEASDVLYSMGTGADQSDKSVYKGLTGAIKYILTSTFLIPTGDDPEQYHEEKTRKAEPTPITAKPSAATLNTIKALKAEIGAELFTATLAQHGVKTPKDVTSEEQAKKLLSELGKVRMQVVAASHGEAVELTEQLWNSLPDTHQAKILREMREKLAAAIGSQETALDEYERIRAESANQWDFHQRLEKAHEFYCSQVGA